MARAVGDASPGSSRQPGALHGRASARGLVAHGRRGGVDDQASDCRPSVARHVRVVRLDAPQREKADWFRSAEEAPEEDWRERIELWRSDVEAILRDVPAAQRLVLGGSLDALDQATVQLIAEISWTTVSVDLSAGADDDASGSFEMRSELRDQLLAGISGHVQALDLCCLHVGRFPDDDIGSEPDERSPFTVLHWPQLRSLSVGHVDQAVVTSIVRNAPMLCELGTHPDTGWGLFGGPAIEERGGQIRRVTIPRATHIEDQPDIRYLEHCPSLARLDWDFQWLVLPSNLLDGVGPGLDTLVLRIACANDIIAASGAILIGLRSARWQLRALELVVSSSPYEEASIRAALEALEECCRASGVRFEIFTVLHSTG